MELPTTEMQKNETALPGAGDRRRRWSLRRTLGALRAPTRQAGWPAEVGRALLFLLIGAALVHALAYVSDTLAPDWNTRFLQTDRRHVRAILQQAPQMEALALGNSHTGSLNMAALGYEEGYRFPRADGDLFEVQQYLETLIPRLPNVKVVFIPISYFSFAGDNSASEEVAVRRSHMYSSLPSWRFLPGDAKHLLSGKSHTYLPLLRLLRPDNWEAVAYALLGSPPEEEGFVEVAADDCTYLGEAEMQASVENRVAKYMRLAEEMRANHPGLEQDVVHTVQAIDRYLKSQGVQAVFFTPPYLQSYSDYYQAHDPQTVAQMRQLVAQLQQADGDGSGITYYDFSQEAEFTQDRTLYRDADHLNGCGARLFSARFREVLEGE